MATHSIHAVVLYASAQGSTREIAHFIGLQLRSRGALVEVADIEEAPALSGFNAVIIGSAIHNMAWLPAAADYVRTHRDDLNSRDVWLFSVGLGPALRGPIGRWFGRQVPSRIAALRDSVAPRGYRSFAGRIERSGPWWVHWVYVAMGGGRYGDLRDWESILAWSETIAGELRLSDAASTHQ
ncbi:flavodoxin domain-containing protein [Nocardia huaxiensis]|uniref:Flavodoxin domain-containing protein n=1 Tax=Nocardia huaxiensis TaxID=2755382 RepID=A0A7D6YZN6_9NOCA|nr:flavodoxin domain-containing protein [Nocardia huaxiensis]QLY28586.1 flavodoxin domain-containing protein [Nocardia huaxiensis]UFS97944.1 flavodoxin domain-containing protein [Nocardia huaxiensis]